MTIAWLASPTRAVVVGDADLDGDVDLKDFAALQSCFGGMGQPIPASCTTVNSWSIDINGDGSVDEIDFDAVAACVSGADVAASATCDLPQFNVIISGPASVEDGHSAVLTAITTTGTGPITFDWQVVQGSAVMVDPQTANPTIWINGTQDIIITVSATDLGAPPFGSRFATDSFVINIEPHPPLTFQVFAGSDRTVDINEANGLDLFGAYFDPNACPEIAILWEWQLVATPPGGSGWFDKPHRLGTPSEPVRFTFNVPFVDGVYTFALTALNSCSGLSDSDTVVVDVMGASGATFLLTAGTDSLVGTDSADVFEAPANTLGDNDSLDGKAGLDELNASLLGVDLSASSEVPVIANIEVFNLEALAGASVFRMVGQQPATVNLSGGADFEWFDFDPNQGTTVNLNAYKNTVTFDFNDEGLGGAHDTLNIVFDDVGTDSAGVTLQEGDGEHLENLILNSIGGANKVNLTLTADVNVLDVAINGGSDFTIEAESDDLTGMEVDASNLGAIFTVRADMDGGGTLNLTNYTGLDMVELFDGGGSDPDIAVQEGAGVLFTESYDDPSITVDGAAAAGQNNNSQTVYLAGDADVDLDDVTIDEVENITINSDTTDEGNPSAHANSIDDLFADELDVLTITGSTDLTFGDTLGQTHAVENVLAGGFTGNLTISFDGQGDGVAIEGGSGDDFLGGSDVNDVIDGGDGDDIIIGNDGDDSLIGGEGDDEFVFEATAAANGNDEIEDFTEGADALNLSAFAGDDDVTATVSDTSTGDVATANGNIFIVTDADGSTDTPAEVAAMFSNGGGTVFNDTASANVVLLIRDDSGDETAVWYVDNDATEVVTAGECAQVATLMVLMAPEPECSIDNDCDDGLFCNGIEACEPIEQVCVPGLPPCIAAAELCDESGDICVDCPDDGLFCTGSPVLSAGTCGYTAVPCGQGETCNESTDTCDPIPGVTFNLTAGVDVFFGTANADTFTASLGTLGDNDQLDGGLGPDTLNVDFVGDLSTPTETPTLTSVETIHLLSDAMAGTLAINGEQPRLLSVAGSADLEYITASATADTTIRLDGYSAAVTTSFPNGLLGPDDAITLAMTMNTSGTSTVALNDVGAGSLEQLVIQSSPGPNVLHLVTAGINGIGSWIIEGHGDFDLSVAPTPFLSGNVDVSEFTGFLEISLDVDSVGLLDFGAVIGPIDRISLFDSNQTTLDDPNVIIAEGTVIAFEAPFDDPGITVIGASGAGQNNNNQTVYLASDADVSLDELTIDEVENITINSDTTDEDDPDARENTIDDLFADELDVLTITGSTDLTFGDVLGQTHAVEDVLAGGFTGDLTVSFDGQGDGAAIQSGSGDDVLGGSDVNDIIEGGDGDDRITGNDGDDSLIGGSGDDEFVFGATAAANGNDDIEDFTTGEDALNFTAFATDDDISGTLSDTSTGDQVIADNEIWVITDADGSTDTAAEIAAFFGGGGTVFDTGIANADIVLLIRDNSGGETAVWYVDNDATASVAAGECVQVATLVDFNGAIGDDEIVD